MRTFHCEMFTGTFEMFEARIHEIKEYGCKSYIYSGESSDGFVWNMFIGFYINC